MSELRFCERSPELEILQDRWKLASNVEDPKPQLVVISGGQGFGKTRLALEFYRSLSGTKPKEDGYWPDSNDTTGKNIAINSNPADCNFQVPIPHLWWGLRAADPGPENSTTGDAIPNYDQFLLPHLAALLVKSRMRGRIWKVANAWATVGIDATLSALQIDSVISVAKATFKTGQLLMGTLTDNALNEALGTSISRSDAIISDMEKVFNRSSVTYAWTPGVIFLDDMQFADQDAALPNFLERLLHTAVMQRWPVMILVTESKESSSLASTPNGRLFANILRHIRNGLETDRGPVAGLPGGYMKDSHFVNIDLGRVSDLSPALSKILPGLHEDQQTSILDRVDGNPRFLAQLIADTLISRGWFEDRNLCSALTEEGLRTLLERSVDVHSVTTKRLSDAPEEVKIALSCASLQGVRFANSMAEEISQFTWGNSCLTGLANAEEPYQFVTGTLEADDVIGSFSERLLYEVASTLHEQIVDLPGGGKQLDSALRQTLIRRINTAEFHGNSDKEDRALTYKLAAKSFEHSADGEDRSFGQRALGELALLELSRNSFESAAEAYERLLAIEPSSSRESEWRSRIETWDRLAIIYENLNWPAKAARAFRNIFWESVSGIPDGFDMFLSATDKNAAREGFEHWKQDHSDFPPDRYLLVASMVASAFLQLGELALARPSLKIDGGDETLGDTPFLVRSEPREVGLNIEKDEEAMPEHEVQGRYLHERAYALGGIFGVGIVEKVHIGILEKLARRTDRDQDSQAAENYLLRALEIANSFGDDTVQIATLSNLGIVLREKGNPKESAIYLGRALEIIEVILAEDTFRANYPTDEEVADSGSSKPQIVSGLDIPVRFSDDFDEDSISVFGKVWTLKQTAANIYGNIAVTARINGNLEAANGGFLQALHLREEIGDDEGVTQDLRNLGNLAHSSGERESACSYWNRCLEVYRKLALLNAGKLSENHWVNLTEELLEVVETSGCGA